MPGLRHVVTLTFRDDTSDRQLDADRRRRCGRSPRPIPELKSYVVGLDVGRSDGNAVAGHRGRLRRRGTATRPTATTRPTSRSVIDLDRPGRSPVARRPTRALHERHRADQPPRPGHPEWLTEVLHAAGALDGASRVTDVSGTGVGTGQVGDSVRFTLTYDGDAGPATVVGKFPADDETSRAASAATRTYEVETRFYQQLQRPGRRSPPPKPYVALLDVEANEFVLLMNDLAPAEQGDQIAGCDADAAAMAMDEVAQPPRPGVGRHHPRRASTGSTASNAEGQAILRVAARDALAGLPRPLRRPRRCRGRRDRRTRRRAPRRLPGAPPRSAHRGPRRLPARQHAVRHRTASTADDGRLADGRPRPRRHRHRLLHSAPACFPTCGRATSATWSAATTTASLAGGVTDYPFDRCWDDYRRYAFGGFLMAVLASMLVGQTDRGDEMFMAMANRSGRMAIDLEATSFLT